MKKGFTIVELLLVVAIIGVLLGIVSVAATGALKSGRTKRANAVCSVLQQAIAAYYAKTGEWPRPIEEKANNMGDSETWTFEPADTDAIFREIVKASVGSGASMPLLDTSGLFVCDASKLNNNGEGCYDNHGEKKLTKTFCANKKCIKGRDFSTVKGMKENQLTISKMAFGFQGTENGRFCRFWITYNGRTDSVTVSRRRPGYEYPESWK